MKHLYAKVFSVVRKDNSIMLYLDRPLGYTITPMSLYELSFQDKTCIAPIANGNTVKAMKFLIKKNKPNYWINKLTERDILKINPVPVYTFKDFTPSEQDVFFSVNQGVAPFISYFTEPEYITPAKFIMQIDSLNDCFELPLLSKIFQNNLQIYVAGKSSASQRQIVKSDKNLSNIIKFDKAINHIPTDSKVYVSTEYRSILDQLSNLKINYTNIPIIL